MANGNGKSGAQLDREINDILIARQKREAKAGTKSPRASSATPSQVEYERRERSEAQQRLTEIRRQPLSDRKEAAAAFLTAMRGNPALVAERIGWLIDGSYGYGAMLLAKQVIGSPRMNRSAALTQMIGAFEWMAPEEMVRAAWKKLTAGEKVALERAVQGAIARARSAE